jgi:peptidoglycan/LPS O-acetylase OafA/YrhL
MTPIVVKHLPELDGLRGIAILAVIVHHQLTPFVMSGGFLGVDLFFVLSGFLITSLLLREFEKTGSISLKNFYMRRLLRLGPALALYLAATILVNHRTQAIEMARQMKLVAFAVFYSTNWRMAFQWDSSLDPTAIIWSLSIEEQFYLLWPLVLFGCLALKLKRRFIAGGLVIVVLSVVAHRLLLLESGSELTRLYYGTDTRADAILMGCLFGLLQAQNIALRTRTWLKLAGVFCAVALLTLFSTIEFSDELLYRGGFTGVALLSAVLIYAAANSPSRVLSLALRFKPLVWFGQISYGLYLWHWLVVRNASFPSLGRWEQTARLSLAVGIAALSFYFLEKPFNQLKSRFTTQKPHSDATHTTTSPENLTGSHTPLAAER